jgi:site-specific recombinase XerD
VADLIVRGDRYASNLAIVIDKTADDELSALRADATPAKTHATYESAWRLFQDWCEDTSKKALPASADTLAHYVLYLSKCNLALATAHVALAAIVREHKKQNAYSERHDPIVEEALRGMARRQIGRPEAKRAALTVDLLEKVVAVQPTTLTGVRNRALLLLGFATATRSEELVSLRVEDIRFESRAQGTVCIRKSKTDQEGVGAFVPIYRAKAQRLCPMQALRDWTIAAGIRSGPLFRRIDCWGNVAETPLDAKAVYLLVKQSCARAGLDPKLFGSHSLRAGFVTSAVRKGVPLEIIMRTTRHKNINTLLGYVREIKAMENGAGKDLL